MKGLFTPTGILLSALALSGCELTDEDKEKLDSAAADLRQIADQIRVTYPANEATISDSNIIVRAYIPSDAEVDEDGLDIALTGAMYGIF
ncbi:MAG: hypothetical protein V7785_24755, partial [Bermanella sp.]